MWCGVSLSVRGGIQSFLSQFLQSWLQGSILKMLDSFSPALSFHLSRGHSYHFSLLNLKVVSAYLCNVSAPGVPDLIKTVHLLFSVCDIFFLGSISKSFNFPSILPSYIVHHILSQVYVISMFEVFSTF